MGELGGGGEGGAGGVVGGATLTVLSSEPKFGVPGSVTFKQNKPT